MGWHSGTQATCLPTKPDEEHENATTMREVFINGKEWQCLLCAGEPAYL